MRDHRVLWVQREGTSCDRTDCSSPSWLSPPAALAPAVIIPGHQVPGASNDLSALEFMKKYMQDWDNAVAASKNADDLRARMKKTYPNLGMENLLNNGAAAAFKN